MNYQEFRDLCCHYLRLSQVNYTATHLSDCVTDLSHDKINRFLHNYFTDEKSLYEKLYLETGALPADQRQGGMRVKVKELAMDVKLYPVTVSSNRTDYILTNDLKDQNTDQIK